MTAKLIRPSVGLLSVIAALTVTAATALPASAATTPTGPRVSLAEATKALPTPASIPPGNVTEFDGATIPKPTGLSPCGLADPSLGLDLHDNGAAIGSYGTAPSAPLRNFSEWIVSARVYASG